MSALINGSESPDHGLLQTVIDRLFDDLVSEEEDESVVSRLDVVITAESQGLPEDLLEIVSLLPPGDYTRQALCDQLNSAMTGHAWGQVYGTVE